MLRIIRKASIVGVICVLAITTTPKAAKALDATHDGMYQLIGGLGACDIYKAVDSSRKYAHVSVVPAGYPISSGTFVKDKYWNGIFVYSVNAGTPPFAAVLNWCVTSGGTITNLVQYGFTALSFDAENFIGFSYTLNGTSYTHGVGTPPPLDITPPVVALTSNATDPQSGAFTVTATFTEAVTGLTADEFVVTNGTKGTLSGSGTTYTIEVTPTGDGPVTVDVAAGVAQDAALNGNVIASQLSVTTDGTLPTVTITGPTDVVTEDFTVTFTFSEGVTGFTADDVTVTNGTKGAFAEPTNGSVYTLVITPELGTTVSVSVAADTAEDTAGNGNEASTTFTVSAGSPASYFAEQEAEIKAIITQDATRSLTSTLSSNQRMTRGARSRFIESRGQGDGDGAGLATRNNVPFDVDGTFDLAGARVSSKGTFFGQTGNVEGTERRLVFGDFDVQRDGDTGSTTATLTGRVAWEQMISDDTMLGYFVGGELADSNISGAFEGSQTRVAATAGGYAVRALSETLFADGFISIGAGRNNLAMADDVLALESTYTTRTATVGGALTGVYAYERYELRPELAFSYGKTWIGDVGFTGVAYGLTDDTLSLDAGNVSIANLTLRPEIVWALDAEKFADSNAQLSFAPRLICERTTTATTTQNCGAGAEIGLSSNSEDGLSSANIRFVMDRVGNSNRSNVVFNVEQRF